jgi:hypothetical protein
MVSGSRDGPYKRGITRSSRCSNENAPHRDLSARAGRRPARTTSRSVPFVYIERSARDVAKPHLPHPLQRRDFQRFQRYPSVVERVWGVLRFFRRPTELRGAWTWFLYGFGPTVLIPVVVILVTIKISGSDPSISEMGGRGDFAFMAVALAAGAHATVRRFPMLQPHKSNSPGDPNDPHTLSGLTMLILIIAAAVWGVSAGLSDAHSKTYDIHFAAVVGIVVLCISAVISIAVAIADARLTKKSSTLTVVAEGAGAGTEPSK